MAVTVSMLSFSYKETTTSSCVFSGIVKDVSANRIDLTHDISVCLIRVIILFSVLATW